jgi:hypothetical protein
MGVRSDVFLAVKAAIQDEFKKDFEAKLVENYGAKVYLHPEGTAYSMEYVKWYYDDLVALYRWLGEQKGDDFIVIEACAEYPDESAGNFGDWDDNPWGAERYYRVSIEFYREPK